MPNSSTQANLTIRKELLPRLRRLQGWRQLKEPHHPVNMSKTIAWLADLGEAVMKDDSVGES